MVRSFETLEGHTNIVSSVAFSPDDVTIAFGSDDGILQIMGFNHLTVF